MFDLIQKLYTVAGKESKRLTAMFIFDALKSLFEGMTLGALSYFLLTVCRSIFNGVPITMQHCVITALIMLASITGKIIFSYCADRNKNIAAYRLGAENRLVIGDLLTKVQMGFFSSNKIGDISAGLTTGIGGLETSGMFIIELFLAGIIQTVIMSVCILPFDPITAAIIFIALALGIFSNSLFQKKADAVTGTIAQLKMQLHTDVLEYIQGIAVVKAFGRTAEAVKSVTGSIEKNRTGFFAVEKTVIPAQMLLLFIFKCASALIIAVSLYRYSIGMLPIEKTIMLIIASFIVFSGFEMAGTMQSMRGIAQQNLETIFKLKNTATLSEGTAMPQGQADIAVHDMSFGYTDEKLFEHINLHIPKNTVTALVGYSGSGKTSLCHLIARFWDAQKGEILLGNTDIKSFNYDAFLSNFTFVFQDVYLFEDTVRNNIAFGKPDASDEAVIAAAHSAQCHDFIMQLPNGYNTILQEGGSNLSGGERQRISIARAFLKPGSIVILDEATSSVDPENEEKLMKALAGLLHNKTALIIAHRMKTVMQADQIAVLDKGNIVQLGTHESLKTQDGIYKTFITNRTAALNWTV